MENISQELNLRPLSQIDQKYMDHALQFLEDYQILRVVSNLIPHKFDITGITLDDFKEWLGVIGNPDKKVLAMNDDKKLVSFSLALIHFYKADEFPLTIIELTYLIRLSPLSFQHMVVIMIQSLYLLEKIIDKNQLQPEE